MNEKTLAACLCAALLLSACSHEVFYDYEGARSTLFDVAREQAGSNCPHGGQRLRLGTDANRDGILSPDEVASVEYICDAASGLASQIYVTRLTEGLVCPYGGQRIDLGVDADGSGTLSGGEIEASHYICDDARAHGWSEVTALSASADFTCALLANRDVACWGLSPDLRDQAVAPAVVAGLSKAVEVGPGCALIADGTVECWGGVDAEPRRVPNLWTATAIAGSPAAHACAVLADKTAVCWGANESGQLGNGTAVASSAPVPVFAGGVRLTGVAQVAVGARHSCAVLEDGGAACWGDNAHGQLGNGDPSVKASGGALPVRGAEGQLAGVLKIALGDDHSCALLAGGAIHCWGSNALGQLGGAVAVGEDTAEARPAFAGNSQLSGAAALAAGAQSTCAVTGSGTVMCWGDNGRGQLGDRTRLGHSASPVQVKLARDGRALGGVRSLALGSRHACALSSDGAVYCWGRNRHGQMGNGQVLDFELYSPRPVPFEAGGDAALALGALHGCLLGSDGLVKCWGLNERGQLGESAGNAWLFSASPLQVAGLADKANLVASSPSASHSCAVLANTTLQCWGANGAAQLGDGSSTLWKTPVQVAASPEAPLSGAIGVAVGQDHTCALLEDRQTGLRNVACWGANADGQLGNGTSAESAVPVNVAIGGSHSMADVEAGEGFTCGRTTSGAVLCWGRGSSGQLGNGSRLSRSSPVQVTELSSGVRALALGAQHACAVTSSGTAMCWGDNADGQLGNGTSAAASSPRRVSGLSQVTSLSLGQRHSCAVVEGGEVWCWGNNAYGQLGDGTTQNRLNPVRVPGLFGAASVRCGAAHTCASLQDGSARCWGWNAYGQLGAFPGQLGAVEGALFP